MPYKFRLSVYRKNEYKKERSLRVAAQQDSSQVKDVDKVEAVEQLDSLQISLQQIYFWCSSTFIVTADAPHA